MIKKLLRKFLVRRFFELESATAILLGIATVLALFLANSAFSEVYFSTLKISLPINFEVLQISKDLTLKEWINDALMALFFLLIGLELKKEVLIGELSCVKKVALPAFAAVGGVVFPALIFYAFNMDHPQNLRGFAIPTATDIAFAYGIISFFGKRIPYALKVFIVTLAVLDDLLAIIMIAVFYTQDLKITYLALAILPLLGLALLNYLNYKRTAGYLLLGILLWLMILQSGIHATLSGVLLALFIPLRVKNDKKFLENLAHKISPAINFVILPIFALANSGVKIGEFSMEIFADHLTLGIMCGLFFGKQIGVMLFSFLAVKLKMAKMPTQGGKTFSWWQFYPVAIFTGIGFTMSLFIGELSFLKTNMAGDSLEMVLNHVKIGILVGSALSIIYGTVLALYIGKNRKKYEI